MDLGSVIGPYKLTNGRYRLSKLSEIVDRSDSVERVTYIINLRKLFVQTLLKQYYEILKNKLIQEQILDNLRQYSEDKGSAIEGGDLGWFKKVRW